MRKVVPFVLVSVVFCLVTSPLSAKDDAVRPTSPRAVTPFTLKNKEIEIRDVLQMIARAAGCSLVMGKEVRGKISVELVNVNPFKAIDAICMANGYMAHEFDKEDKIFLVVPLEKAEQLMRIQAFKRRQSARHRWQQRMGQPERGWRRQRPPWPRPPRPMAGPPHDLRHGDDFDGYDDEYGRDEERPDEDMD